LFVVAVRWEDRLQNGQYCVEWDIKIGNILKVLP